MKYKPLLSLYFALLLCSCLAAQLPSLERIEPMFWWVGMKNPKLQLIVHGNNIAGKTVQLNYAGVKLAAVHKADNPNYLFLDLEISAAAAPGTFTIRFSAKNEKSVIYNYALKARDKSPNRIQGVTSKDLIYLIMPDRFSNGNPNNDVVPGMKEAVVNRDSGFYRHGGDLQGIMNHLDYLKELGITAIWCTPEIENDQPKESFHGYAVTDHYKIDPRIGTNELYKLYVEKCHSMGLKVIKDVVHNHIGSEHWLMKDLPMASWVHQWPQFTKTTYKDQTVMDPYASSQDKKLMQDGWFDHHMPDMNENNAYVQNYLTQNHIWWVEYAGIDGLRLDTYPYNDPVYMADWAVKVKAEFPRLGIFGEALVGGVVNQAFFTEGSTINQHFDTHLPGVTDVQVKDGIYEALNGKFDWSTGVNRLYSTLANDFVYQDASRNVIFLDNHDMSRFFSMAGEDFNKFKTGIAMLFTTRGIPQIYYGTEILMKNFSNPDALVREDFKGGWPADAVNKFLPAGRSDMENDAFNYVKKLANYRKDNPVLQTGKLMQYVPERGIYVYFRYNNEKTVMVIVNSNETAENISTARFAERMNGYAKAEDVISGAGLPITGTINITAKHTAVLELKK